MRALIVVGVNDALGGQVGDGDGSTLTLTLENREGVFVTVEWMPGLGC